jgi:hypothetical protein
MLLENSWPSLFALVVIGVAVWFAMQPRCAFIVRINRGHPKAVRGKVMACKMARFAD